MKSNIMKRILMVMTILFLTSCSLLSPVRTTPDSTYLITAVPADTPVMRKIPITLMVMQPDASPAYNTTDMAYSKRVYQIAYFAKNRWAETPPQMLQPLIVQTLQNTHRFWAVVSPPYTGRYDYALATTILKLEQDYTYCPALLKLKARAQLIKIESNGVIATQDFSITEPIFANTPYNGVIAANMATQRLLRGLSDFCIRKVR